MRRLLAAALALLTAVAPAEMFARSSAPPEEIILFNGSPNFLIPSATLNFSGGAYSGGCGSASACLQTTRASTIATDLVYTDAAGSSYTTYAANTARIRANKGLLVEDNRTNFLLHSCIPRAGTVCDTGPATQTTGTLPNGAMILWVMCASSSPQCAASLSNGTATGCSGVATQGNPAYFTTAGSGTCTVTVTGTIEEFQMEAGATNTATSFIPTAAATVARGTEAVKAIGALAAAMDGASGFMHAELSGATSSNAVIADRNISTKTDILIRVFSGNIYRSLGPSFTISANPINGNTTPIGATASQASVTVGWSTAQGVDICWNSGTCASTSLTWDASAPDNNIGSAGTTSSVNYFIKLFSVGTYRPTNAVILSSTNGWSPTFTRFIGDSRTFGVGGTYSYPNQTMAGIPGGYQAAPYAIAAVAGTDSAYWIANWASAVAPFNYPGIKKCVDILSIGVNDFGNGRTVTALEANLTTLAGLSHGQGCIIGYTTELPANSALSNWADLYQVYRDTLRAWVQANTPGIFDFIVDAGVNTNVGIPNDFTASISGTTMTVTAVASGAIRPDSTAIFGHNGNTLAASSIVVSQQSGTPGGAGSYTISPSQTAASGEIMQGKDSDLNCFISGQVHLTGYPPASPAVCGPYFTGGYGAWALGSTVPALSGILY